MPSRLRATGGISAAGVFFCGSLRTGSGRGGSRSVICTPDGFQNSRSRTDAAIIIDHAKTGHEGAPRIWHCRAYGVASQLSYGLDKTQKTASSACLTNRQLTATGIMRKAAGAGQVMSGDEIRAAALVKKSLGLSLIHI